MKKEWVSLTQAERAYLETLNKIWLSATMPILRIYLIGVALAFAVVIGASYLTDWSDRLGAFVLIVIAILTGLIARLLWPNILRNLDLAWSKKRRLETQEYEIKEGTDERTVTIPGMAKPFTIHHELLNEPGKKQTLVLEYSPWGRTIFSATQNPIS